MRCWFGMVVIGNQITATREVSGSLFQCIAGLAWLSLATKSPLLVRSRSLFQLHCWFGVVVIGNQIEVSESISVHSWFGVVIIGYQITATREVSESISVHCWFGVVVIGNQITATRECHAPDCQELT